MFRMVKKIAGYYSYNQMRVKKIRSGLRASTQIVQER